MTVFPYALSNSAERTIGLVVLQADLSIEADFRRLTPESVNLLVSRVPSGEDVTSETLAAMAGRLTEAASLFPRGLLFDAIGYGCTSGAAEIGPERVAALVTEGAPARAVTEPTSALIAACRALGVRRLAILSPYVESVSAKLRDVIAEADVETPVFGGFDEPSEAKVARICEGSIIAAAEALVAGADVDALFLSCTNLRALDAIAPLEDALGLPVLASNQVLAWRLLGLAGAEPRAGAPGRLFTRHAPLAAGVT